ESGGQCSELTHRVARIGSSGRNPQNAERDLMRLLDLPEPYHITVPVRVRGCPGKHEMFRLPIILPH
ncbi:unnamed protein product, partial [Effrenium voratum]